jgi:hypothetical protein
MVSSSKKGKTTYREAREVAQCVIQECNKEAQSGAIKVSVQKEKYMPPTIQESWWSVSRIRKECQEVSESLLCTLETLTTSSVDDSTG